MMSAISTSFLEDNNNYTKQHKMASLPPRRSLLQFLKDARNAHLQFIASRAESPIYVVGNPSVDLDSIIAAIVYSYFAHNRNHINPPRPHVPLINLPTVSAGPELRRLRPEFVKALWLCTGKSGRWDDTPESAGEMLREHIATVQDFATHLGDSLGQKWEQCAVDAIMVDWNAMPVRSSEGPRGRGSVDGLSSVTFQVLGCIDHHADEKFLPSAESLPPNQPLVVKPAGSCTSLVVNTLREQCLWSAEGNGNDNKAEEAQVAQLALAAILIDTANLTSKDKVTTSDTDAFAFLSPKLEPLHHIQSTGSTSNQNQTNTITTQYYNQIQEAKQNSLELLTIDEILVRDYKYWEEPSQHTTNNTVKLGFCSTVKSLPWIINKAGNPQTLLNSLNSLCTQENLDIVVVMTAFTSTSHEHKGHFCRELFICTANGSHNITNDALANALNAFVAQSGSKLGLVDWSPLDDVDGSTAQEDVKSALNQGKPQWRHLWVQTNMAMSRKQVAPLLREAVAK